MSQSDSELWKLFKAGDKPAFKEIYYRHYMALYRHGLKLAADEELAQDSIQDLFLKLWRNREQLCDVLSISSYLYRAYSNTVFDALKKSKRSQEVAGLNEESSEPTIEDILISNQLATEKNAELKLALQQLTKRQKQVVELYYYEGLSYKQISEILPLQYQAIRNCVHEALKVLRKNINRNFTVLFILSELIAFFASETSTIPAQDRHKVIITHCYEEKPPCTRTNLSDVLRHLLSNQYYWSVGA